MLPGLRAGQIGDLQLFVAGEVDLAVGHHRNQAAVAAYIGHFPAAALKIAGGYDIGFYVVAAASWNCATLRRPRDLCEAAQLRCAPAGLIPKK